MEVATAFLRAQMNYAFKLSKIVESREYLDSLTFHDAILEQVVIASGSGGRWFEPASAVPGRTLLYLHGGGYAFYTRAHDSLIAHVACATRARTLAIDYRLTPEHRHPAQLEDAMTAYRALLAAGTPPSRLVVAGDSAGGNLLLALLLHLRDHGMPLPALGIGLCPWTDIGPRGDSLRENDRYDWVGRDHALWFATAFAGDSDPHNPALSPIYASLAGLPRLYIQAGSREILFDMIVDFVAECRRQGATVTFDAFENMNHDFQAFGALLPESRRALARIAEEIGDALQE